MGPDYHPYSPQYPGTEGDGSHKGPPTSRPRVDLPRVSGRRTCRGSTESSRYKRYEPGLDSVPGTTQTNPILRRREGSSKRGDVWSMNTFTFLSLTSCHGGRRTCPNRGRFLLFSTVGPPGGSTANPGGLWSTSRDSKGSSDPYVRPPLSCPPDSPQDHRRREVSPGSGRSPGSSSVSRSGPWYVRT